MANFVAPASHGASCERRHCQASSSHQTDGNDRKLQRRRGSCCPSQGNRSPQRRRLGLGTITKGQGHHHRRPLCKRPGSPAGSRSLRCFCTPEATSSYASTATATASNAATTSIFPVTANVEPAAEAAFASATTSTSQGTCPWDHQDQCLSRQMLPMLKAGWSLPRHRKLQRKQERLGPLLRRHLQDGIRQRPDQQTPTQGQC